MTKASQSGRQRGDSPQDVFVVRGRNRLAYDTLRVFLRTLGLQPFDFDDAVAQHAAGSQQASPYAGAVIEAAFDKAAAILILLTGDEMTELMVHLAHTRDLKANEHLPQPQARPNVIFEAGYALGRYPERTVIVSIGYTKPFSDIAGRHYLDLTNSNESKSALVGRLRSVGCRVGAYDESALLGIDFEQIANDIESRSEHVRTSRSQLERLSRSLHRVFDRTRDDSEQFLVDRINTATRDVFLFGVGRQLYLSPNVAMALESAARRLVVELFVSDPFCDNRAERYRLEPTKDDRPVAFGTKVAAHQFDPRGFMRGVGQGLIDLERRVAGTLTSHARFGLRLRWHHLPLNMVLEKFDDCICVSLYGYKQRAPDSPVYVYVSGNEQYTFFAEQVQWIRGNNTGYAVWTTDEFLSQRQAELQSPRKDDRA